MDVIRDGFLEINSVEYSQYVESIETSFDNESQESRPFNQTSVARDVGLDNNSFTVNIAELSTWAFTIAMEAIKNTKVTFEIRPDGAAVSATNPKYTGSVLVKPPSPSFAQGEGAKYSMVFELDGAYTFATA